MNNDLISREALKEAIAEWKYHGFYDKLIEVIDNAPSVSPYKAIHDELHKGEQKGGET